MQRTSRQSLPFRTRAAGRSAVGTTDKRSCRHLVACLQQQCAGYSIWRSAPQATAVRRPPGDILAVTDATGARVASYDYGPWGELVSTTGTFTQPWRYAGYYLDDDTSLYYLQQRYYSPTLARFLTKEPMFSDFCTDCGFQAMLNSAPTTSPYADNRPLTFVDPDGRKPWYKKAKSF